MVSVKTKKLYMEINQTHNRSDYLLTPIPEEPDLNECHDDGSQYIQHADYEVGRSSQVKDNLSNDFVELGVDVKASYTELQSPLQFASRNVNQKVPRKVTPFQWTNAANNDVVMPRIPRIRIANVTSNLENQTELDSVVNVDDGAISLAQNTKIVRDLLDELDRIESEVEDPRTQLDDAKKQGLVNLRRMVLSKNVDIEKFKLEMTESVNFLEQTVRIQLMELDLMKGQVKNLLNNSSDCDSEAVACSSTVDATTNDNGCVDGKGNSSDNKVSENKNESLPETISIASTTESVRWLEKSGTWSCVTTSQDEAIKTGRLKKFGRFLLNKIKPKRKE